MPDFSQKVRELQGDRAGRQVIGIAQALHFLQTAARSVKAWEVESHSGLSQPQMSIVLNTLSVIGWANSTPGGFQQAAEWTWTGPNADDADTASGDLDAAN